MASHTPADVVIIGGGPGGYVAAIRAAQLGLVTVCVEMEKTLGGTCVNVGCIPSKALLNSSEHVEFLRQHAAEHGIGVGDLRIDLAQMLKRKDDVVLQNTKGIEFLFRKRNSIPFVFCSTTSSLRFSICARSMRRSPTPMPCSAACWRRNSTCSEELSNALDGMQPTLTQVPPSVFSISTQTVTRPSWAARIAAT